MKMASPSLSFLFTPFLFLIFFQQNCTAQETEPTFWDRVQFGGGLGIGFGNGFFSGTLAPSAIYNFNE
ncbi:MAG: hypothetical protein R3359_05815 [Marinirhabdus sp.]|nr:hypothetical protein [Marinirhabdus sp.]